MEGLIIFSVVSPTKEANTLMRTHLVQLMPNTLSRVIKRCLQATEACLSCFLEVFASIKFTKVLISIVLSIPLSFLFSLALLF